MSRSIAVVSTLVLAMVGVAWLELRTPDFGQAIAFFTSRIPTLAAGVAVMSVLAWAVVITAAFATLWLAVRGMHESHTGRRPTSYASLFLVAGVMLLVVGAVRHSLPSASVCCGSGASNVQEAVGLAH